MSRLYFTNLMSAQEKKVIIYNSVIIINIYNKLILDDTFR